MAVKKAPVVYLFSWRLVVPLSMLAILIAAGSALGGFSAGVYGGLGAFFLWAIGSQRWLRRRFYRGIRLYRRMEYAEAIPHFQRDLDYWNRFPKVDDWRIVALLSPTPYPYRSSDPRCIGVRHMKCGRIEEARRTIDSPWKPSRATTWPRGPWKTSKSLKRRDRPGILRRLECQPVKTRSLPRSTDRERRPAGRPAATNPRIHERRLAHDASHDPRLP